MLVKQTIDYQDQDTILQAYYVFDDAIQSKRPLVLVAHDWSGRNEFAENNADRMAKLGYVGFALDMFGKGRLGKTTEEKMALMQPVASNRELLQRRMIAAFDCARQLEQVDAERVAALGFCFGGMCVLDLARSGVDIAGVVSAHGLFTPPSFKNKTIKAKVLALHGQDDPMVNQDQVMVFEAEMTEANVDWQLHVFGKTKHAFMNPLANDSALGTVYNERAAHRSWIMIETFFTEIL